MKLTLPYPPSANRYWRNVKGRMVKSKDAREYRLTVQAQAGHDHQPASGDVRVTIHLYRPQASGDLDNFQKVVLDSLQGIAFDNDKQVVEIHAYRHEGRGAGRVEVEVEALAEQARLEVGA